MGWADAYNRFAYANNNPIANMDADGRCPTGSKHYSCIEAHRVDKGGKNIKLTKSVEHFASSRAVREKMAGRDHKEESLRAITQDSNGKFHLTPLSDTKGSDSRSGKIASGGAPADAQAIIHGHTQGMDMRDQAGLGDSQPLTIGKPNVTVSSDGQREGVHEMENGTVQFRMIRGSMTPDEISHIQSNLDSAQHLINPDHNPQ